MILSETLSLTFSLIFSIICLYFTKEGYGTMFDSKIANAYKDHSGYTQDRFIKGSVDYRILKLSKETIVFCNDKELYHYDEKHTEFLKFLSLITDILDQLEKDLEEYYNNAASNNYDYITAQKQIAEITKQFSKMHIFLDKDSNALLYIRRVLYEHFCKKVEHRFVNFLQNHVSKDDLINLQNLEDFRIEDRKFFTSLFRPIIQLIENKNDSVRSCKEGDDIDRTLNELWNYFGYISHCPNNLNEYTKTDKLDKYREIDDIEYYGKYVLNKPILYNLKCISDTFTDYFSIFSKIREYYPHIADFHPYALVLSNCSYQIRHIINSCTYYSAHQTMHEIIDEYIRKKGSEPSASSVPRPTVLINSVPQGFTNDIYRQIKDSINADDNTKTEIVNELFTYYPIELEKYIGAELIEFKLFEQLLAIELFDIIENRLIIKKCPFCNKYFITDSQKQKYCDEHKNQHSVHQKVYKNTKDFESFYQSLFQKHKECLRKRKTRGELSENNYTKWKNEASKIVSNAETDLISKKEFLEKLNSIYLKLEIKPPRAYKQKTK